MKPLVAIRLAALLTAGYALHAGPAPYLSPVPDPFFLDSAGFGIPGPSMVCFSTFCSANNISHDFNYVGGDHGFNGTDQIAVMTAIFSGEIYDSTGTVDLGPYSATGNVTFEFFGRTDDTTGSWDAQMTQDDLSVTAYGHFFSLHLGSPADGHLTVGDPVYVSGYGDGAIYEYPITLSFPVVDGRFTWDPGNGGFSDVPHPFEIDATDTAAAPEPGTMALLALPVVALLRRRLRSRAA